jgi:hypothetical protein
MTFDVTEWWQVKALAVEWLYVLDKLQKSVQPPEGMQICVVGAAWDGQPLYLLHRKYFSAETLASVTGLGVDKLAEFKGILTLKSKANDLPEPTVAYWGTA